MISVIIPTYKNKWSLIHNLKNNLPYLEDVDIIVVNDNPKINLEKDLGPFKNVSLINNSVNKGFGESVNAGVARAKNRYIMLLNDDVVLLSKNYQSAINNFHSNPSLFAIGFAQKEKDGTIVGKNVFFWKRGLFFHKKSSNLHAGENGWAEGGACIIDKVKFEELGGFDSAYSPFYWEDIDLSYRAKKNKYQVIFDPHIVVEHHHESTIGKYFSRDFVKTIAFRNQFLFMWKNSTLREKLIHFLLLPFNVCYYLFKGEFAFVKGFFQAIKKFR
jgi:GT2 family glycosyltransferase